VGQARPDQHQVTWPQRRQMIPEHPKSPAPLHQYQLALAVEMPRAIKAATPDLLEGETLLWRGRQFLKNGPHRNDLRGSPSEKYRLSLFLGIADSSIFINNGRERTVLSQLEAHPMNNKFAGNANSYHGFTFEQTLSGISRAGFKYIELAAVRGWTEHIHAGMSDAELAKAKALIASYGLTSIALAGHANIMEEDRLKDFMDNIDLAAKMDCPFVVTSTGEAHFGKEESLNDDVLVQNIGRLLPKLEQHGITMVIELHGLYHTGEAIARFVKRIDSPLVGINYDTANIVMYGGINPMDDIKKCYPHVKYVHLKDHVGGKGAWNFPATGKGELPLKEFMEYMDGKGYDGPYSIEIEYTQDYCMREKDRPGDILIADKEMQDSFNYLKVLGRV